MKQRLISLLWGELLALASFVFGGLALLGAAVTWTGRSQHPTAVSWCLVALFACGAFMFGKRAGGQLARVFAQRRTAVTSGYRGRTETKDPASYAG